MRKQTAIKVSKEFKQFLVDKKKKGEDFEETIKRLVNQSVNQLTDPSIPVNQDTDDEMIELPDDGSGIPTRISKSLLPWRK